MSGKAIEVDIKRLQNELYKILVSFHAVCMANDLPYFMNGGTQLGAIRHEGFIPWDDDIDVALPRPAYEKLLQLPSAAWPNNLELFRPVTTLRHPYAFCKLINTNTTLVEDMGQGIVQGIGIDVFPLDGVGNNYDKAKKHSKYISYLVQIMLLPLLLDTNQTILSRWKRYVAYILKKAGLVSIFKKIGYPPILKFIVSQMKKYDYDSSYYIGNLAGGWVEKEVLPKSYFGKPTLYRFCYDEFYGPALYHEYLTSLYGDYMQLPPVEKRKSHHAMKYIDFDLPYKEYLIQNANRGPSSS